jgi:transposase-like protein
MVKNDSIRQKMFASIASWQSSELTQKEWCRQQGISYHIYHYWYRKYRDEHPESDKANPFVRLAIKSEAAASCEVVFADGTKILFREPIPALYLKSLLF